MTWKTSIRFLLVIAMLLLLQPAYALHVDGENSESLEKPNRLIVKLKPELKPVVGQDAGGVPVLGLASLDDLNREYKVLKQDVLFANAPVTRSDSRFRNVIVLTVPDDQDIARMQRDYQSLDDVVYAEPDYQVILYDSPDDLLYDHQWALNNTGQGYYHVLRHDGDYNDELVIEYGTPDADIDADEVFQNPPDNTATVIVAIVDTGIDADHPDLQGQIWVNPGEIPDNGIDDDHNGYVDDINGWDFAGDGYFTPPDNIPNDLHGHGTHCSGIVTAVSNNALGVAGITPDCKIMALDFYPVMMSSWAAEAIVYAADNGADVMNMSWGLPYSVQIWEDALDYAREKGMILCAAAGNDGEERINFPAGYDNNIAVAASNSDDFVTDFSTYGSNINVCAPGLSILSLRAAGTDMYASHREPDVHIIDNEYYLASGTSMASPHVVGIAAYLRAVSPGLTHEKAQEIIEQTADDYLDPMGTGANLPGWDIYSGHGRVNLFNAIAAAPQVRAKITDPTPNQLKAGTIDISGIADGAAFTDYVLEYGQGSTPSSWTEITNSSTPVTYRLLGSWDTSGLNGQYTIRLRVGDFNISMVSVYVTNETIVGLISPAEGDTVVGYAYVVGTAICPDFQSLTLEYGLGSNPSTWTTIDEKTAPVVEGNIADWSTGGLNNGTYTLKLSVYSSTSGLEGSATVTIYVQSIFSGESGWTVTLSSTPTLVANYGDFDNDGEDEIVVGTASGIKYFNSDGTAQTTGIPSTPAYDFTTSIAVGDLDGDSLDDHVAVSASPANLYLIYGNGSIASTSLPEAPNVAAFGANEEYKYPLLFLQDINGDGLDEIHYSPSALQVGSYYIFTNEGQPWGCAFPIATTRYGCILSADIDGDSVCEIYVAGSKGILQIDTCGNVIESYTVASGGLIFACRPLSAVDIDDDGKLELIVYGFEVYMGENLDYRIWAFDEGLQLKDGWPHQTGISGFYMLRLPTFGDLNDDGYLEYVSSFWDLYAGFVHAWNLDGTAFIGTEEANGLFAQAPNEAEVTAIILADIDDDGSSEIITTQHPAIFSSYQEEAILAWDHNAQMMPGWPIVSAADAGPYAARSNSPVFGDLDRDGNLDFFMTTADSKLVFAEFEGVAFDPFKSPSPQWRYNQKLNAIKYFTVPEPAGCGDVDASGEIDIDDVVYLLVYIFGGGDPPVVEEDGDVDCSGFIDIDDVVYLIMYIFAGGPAPCADCPE